MKAVLIICLIISLCLGQSSTLQANLFASTVVLKDNVFRIKLGVSGGFPPLVHDFVVVPEKWIHIGEFLFVPEDQAKEPKKFIVRLKIKDSLNNKLDFSVLLVTDGKTIEIQPVAYGFNHVFSAAALVIQPELPQIAPLTIPSFNSTQELLFHLQQAKIREKRTIDPSFSLLPTTTQIDVFIGNANLALLTQTVQSVSALDLTCNAKASYLLQIVGRIKSGIELEKLQMTKLQVLNLAIEKEIQKFNKELLELEKEKSRILLTNLLPVFQLKKAELKNKEYLEVVANAEIQATQFEIARVQFQLDSISKRTLQLKTTVDGYRLILSSPNSNPAQLVIISQELLTIAKQQEELDGKKSKLVLGLGASKQKIVVLRSSIDRIGLEQAILKKQILDITETITANDQKNKAIDVAITLVKYRIRNEQKNLKNAAILVIEQKITQLSTLSISIEAEIDKIYYSCYGVNEFEITVKETSTYTISYVDFSNYALKAFGVAKLTIQETTTIKINVVNILSPVWAKTYGAAFNEKVLAISSGFRFKNDFSCLEPSLLQSNSGTILSIQNNIIAVETLTGKVYVIIGACTRFESLQTLPLTPSKIFWKGVSIIPGVYDAYQVLTF